MLHKDCNMSIDQNTRMSRLKIAIYLNLLISIFQGIQATNYLLHHSNLFLNRRNSMISSVIMGFLWLFMQALLLILLTY